MATPGDAAPLAPSGAEPTFDPTLFDELAQLTPDERLDLNDRMAATVLELRDAFASAAPEDAARPPRRERD
jgi:hypothetical protein